MKLRLLTLAASALLFAAGSPAFGFLIVEMSFEETVQRADVIVLGTVVEVPELGVQEAGTGVVVRDNRVHVDHYLKGDGPSDIVVQTVGGDVIVQKDGHPVRGTVVAGGQPQLPARGTRVLLFLTHYGGSGAFMICSASHGVREVTRFPGSSEDTVNLALQRPDLMSPRAAESYRRARDAGPLGPTDFFHDDVPVSALKDLVQRALMPAPRPQPQAQTP